MKYVYFFLAICGVVFGGWLLVYAFSTRLSSAALGNFALLGGFVIAGGCLTYIIKKVIYIFNN